MRIRTDIAASAGGVYAGDVIVVDDFYSDPDAIRQRALSLDYAPPGGRYPGYESTRALAGAAQLAQFSELAGTALCRGAENDLFGRFRVGVDTGPVTVRVHLDHVDWSAIVYLSPSSGDDVGLSVYRHRELGLHRLDVRRDLNRYGCRTRAEFDKKYVRPATSDAGAWDTMLEIGYQYNRLLLLRSGSLFHGISGLFGSDLETGRMTHSFFMNEEPGEE